MTRPWNNGPETCGTLLDRLERAEHDRLTRAYRDGARIEYPDVERMVAAWEARIELVTARNGRS